jgi:phage tail-like protein
MAGVKFSRDVLKTLTKNQGDFHLANKWGVEIENIAINGCHKIDGIEFEVEVVEYCDGDDIETHCRPGTFVPGVVSIERDFAATKDFFVWRKAVIDGATDRKSVSIMFHSDDNTEAKRLNLYHCFPHKWVGPTLDSRSSAHATEKIELVFEEMEMK